MIRVLGFNLSHDSSVCLVEDGVIRSALALERTTRIKRGIVSHHAYAAAMAELTNLVLADNGLTAAEIDLWIATSTESRNQADEARLIELLGLLAPPERRAQLPHPGHHLAHACAAFYASGYDEAAALVIDAYGSLVGTAREQESAFHFQIGATPKCVLQVLRDSERAAGYPRDGRLWMPDTLCGVGEIYRVVTLALGFNESGSAYDDAGKTMGLASFGKRLSERNLFIDTLPDGGLAFDHAAESMLELGLASRHDNELRLESRHPGTPFEQFHYDLAAQVQEEFEEACLHLTREALSRTGSSSLVASGGSFLNSKLNARLLQETDIDRLFVFPAATDDGNAAGAATYAYHHLAGQPAKRKPTPPVRHVYLGPSRAAGRDLSDLASGWNLVVRRHASDAELAASAAAAISRGEIVGWFQDRGEFGPRALGARSILCHPGIAGMKDRLNARVKFREPFRPFAGSVLAERAAEWFEMPAPESPFMLLLCPVRPERQHLISEITHVDGTCRVQTVAEDHPGGFRSLIQAFERETGLPMVLNTSFNLRGMPIVERPEEAFDCLYGSRLDRLFIGDLEIEAPDLGALRPVAAVAAAAGAVGLQTGGSTEARGTADSTEEAVLGLSNGERGLRAICDELGLPLDQGIDLALELRRHGRLRWAGLPVNGRPTYPLVQYLPLAIKG